MGDKVGENPAALRAAVFMLSAKNRRGGVQIPPSRAKVKNQSPALLDLRLGAARFLFLRWRGLCRSVSLFFMCCLSVCGGAKLPFSGL